MAGVPIERDVYGDPEFDALLPELAGLVSSVAGTKALPTYSFARVYPRGRPLLLHRDRSACEHSISLHLGASAAHDWPLWIRDLEGARRDVVLGSGDGLLYQGTKLQHWRSSCPVTWYAQVFFHFVSAEGPHADELFDRRPGLGMSEFTKR